MSQSTTVSAAPPYALIGSTARWRTVAVPWKPLAWMYGSTGPRREPVDGRRRTVARIVWPTAYMLLTTTSTFPLGTVVGRRRSLTGAPVRTGDAPPHEARAAAARRITIRVTWLTPAIPARRSAWDPVSAPMPWIMPTPNAVFGPYCVAWSDGVCSWPWMR